MNLVKEFLEIILKCRENCRKAIQIASICYYFESGFETEIKLRLSCVLVD
jgi:hypothetical protein